MTEDKKSKVIFDLTREDYNYKGILFADMDIEASFEVMGIHNLDMLPKDYGAGLCVIIWTDEKGIWNVKGRIKFSSGSVQILQANYAEDMEKGIAVNETYCLNDIYKLPLKNKTWTKNPSGSPHGILKIIEDLDMLESMRYEPLE